MAQQFARDATQTGTRHQETLSTTSSIDFTSEGMDLPTLGPDTSKNAKFFVRDDGKRVRSVVYQDISQLRKYSARDQGTMLFDHMAAADLGFDPNNMPWPLTYEALIGDSAKELIRTTTLQRVRELRRGNYGQHSPFEEDCGHSAQEAIASKMTKIRIGGEKMEFCPEPESFRGHILHYDNRSLRLRVPGQNLAHHCVTEREFLALVKLYRHLKASSPGSEKLMLAPLLLSSLPQNEDTIVYSKSYNKRYAAWGFDEAPPEATFIVMEFADGRRLNRFGAGMTAVSGIVGFDYACRVAVDSNNPLYQVYAECALAPISILSKVHSSGQSLRTDTHYGNYLLTPLCEVKFASDMGEARPLSEEMATSDYKTQIRQFYVFLSHIVKELHKHGYSDEVPELLRAVAKPWEMYGTPPSLDHPLWFQWKSTLESAATSHGFEEFVKDIWTANPLPSDRKDQRMKVNARN